MPTLIKREEVDAFAHCGVPICDGHEQQPVKGVIEEIGVTFIERGGDLGGYENTHSYLNFASEEDRACPSCGRDREISVQARLEHAPSGYDPKFLVYEKFGEKIAEQKDEKDQQIAELKAQLDAKERAADERAAALEARIEQLMGAMENMACAVVELQDQGKEPAA